jgi:hypothetical protein
LRKVCVLCEDKKSLLENTNAYYALPITGIIKR